MQKHPHLQPALSCSVPSTAGAGQVAAILRRQGLHQSCPTPRCYRGSREDNVLRQAQGSGVCSYVLPLGDGSKGVVRLGCASRCCNKEYRALACIRCSHRCGCVGYMVDGHQLIEDSILPSNRLRFRICLMTRGFE